MWVQVPPAVPGLEPFAIECVATPPDPSSCAIVGDSGAGYSYLLGLYLGDGMLTRAPRNVWRLRISLDQKYTCIVARAKQAIRIVGDRSAGVIQREGCVELYSNWKHWICLFPQHGPGRKHKRQIVLEPWQERLTVEHPADFLAGLIHSDGCRCINRVKGRMYPRYFFSNRSDDIRAMFVAACASVSVECRPDGPRNVSIARRASVAILDRLVGPKR